MSTAKPFRPQIWEDLLARNSPIVFFFRPPILKSHVMQTGADFRFERQLPPIAAIHWIELVVQDAGQTGPPQPWLLLTQHPFTFVARFSLYCGIGRWSDHIELVWNLEAVVPFRRQLNRQARRGSGLAKRSITAWRPACRTRATRARISVHRSPNQPCRQLQISRYEGTFLCPR